MNCWVIIHCLEVSCKEDQITSAQREWFTVAQLTDKQWIITQQFMQWSWSISILTHNKRRKHIWSLQLLPTFCHCTEELPPILRLRRIRLHVIVTSFKLKTTLHRLTLWLTSFSSDVSYHTLLRWIIVRYITVCYRWRTWLYRLGVLELSIKNICLSALKTTSKKINVTYRYLYLPVSWILEYFSDDQPVYHQLSLIHLCLSGTRFSFSS